MSALTVETRGELREKLAEARARRQIAHDDGHFAIARYWEARAACINLILQSDEDTTMEKT